MKISLLDKNGRTVWLALKFHGGFFVAGLCFLWSLHVPQHMKWLYLDWQSHIQILIVIHGMQKSCSVILHFCHLASWFMLIWILIRCTCNSTLFEMCCLQPPDCLFVCRMQRCSSFVNNNHDFSRSLMQMHFFSRTTTSKMWRRARDLMKVS